MTPEHQPSSPGVAHWKKSSYSADQTACVEVGEYSASTAVRDTQHRDLGALYFSAAEWRAFLSMATTDLR